MTQPPTLGAQAVDPNASAVNAAARTPEQIGGRVAELSVPPLASPAASTLDGEPGSVVPVRWGSKVGTVPIEKYEQAVAGGAEPLSEDEWNDHQAKLMAARQMAIEREQYGHISNQLTAAGVGALESVPIAGPAAIAAIGHATGGTEYMRKSAEWHPIWRGAGLTAGIVVPAILSGGGTAVEEAGAQAAVRGAAEVGGEALARRAVAEAGGEAAAKAIGARETIAGATPAAVDAARAVPVEAARVGATPIVNAAHEAAQATQAAQAATPGAARLAGQVFSAPQNLVTRVGEGVENWVAKQLPAEAQSIAGKLALKAAALGARGAGEGAIYGANDYAAQQALSADPEFDAEKLLAEVGHATLLGGVTGGLLGAGGELASQAIGKAAPILGDLSKSQFARAIMGKGRTAYDMKDLETIEGGWKAAVQQAMDEGVIKPGMDVQEIAAALAPRAEAAGAERGAMLPMLDNANIEGPRAGKMLARFDGEIGKDLDPHLHGPQIGVLKNVADSLRARAEKFGTIASPEAAAAYLKTPAGRDVFQKLSEEDQRAVVSGDVPPALKDAAKADPALSFAEAHKFRQELAGMVNWNRNANGGKVDLTGMLYRKAQSIVENEIQVAAEKGVRSVRGEIGPTGDPLIPEDWLAQYKAKGLKYARLKVLSRAADKGALQAVTQAQGGLAGYAGLVSGAVIGAVHGGLPGALMGLASGVAAKTVKERGASTAGVLLDRLSTLGALQQVSARGDMKIANGAKAILSGAKVAVKAPRHGLDSFEDKADAVKAAMENPQGHLEQLQRAAAGIMPHAPSTASAFVSAAFKATQYLASVMPERKPLNPAMPNAGYIEPSAHQKMVFAKVVDSVDNPHRAIAEAASDGKWVPQQFAAIQATHPKLYDAYIRELAKESIKATAPPKADRALLLTALTGKPATPAMMQQNIAMQQASFPQKDGKADKGVAGQPGGGGGTSAQSRGIPKAAKLSFASQTSLTPKSLAP